MSQIITMKNGNLLAACLGVSVGYKLNWVQEIKIKPEPDKFIAD